MAWFRWSNLGLLIAINGAELLRNAEIGLIPLVIIFVVFTGFMNLFMGSASAKWAILGPVFVPIFMLLGYSPELSQAVYRVGDSITNIISPMMSFFALIIVYYQKYDKKSGIGTIMATMMPYIAFFVVWTLLLIVWIILGLPLGPEAPLYYAEWDSNCLTQVSSLFIFQHFKAAYLFLKCLSTAFPNRSIYIISTFI